MRNALNEEKQHHYPDYANRAYGKLDQRCGTDHVRAAVRAMGDIVCKRAAVFPFDPGGHRITGPAASTSAP